MIVGLRLPNADRQKFLELIKPELAVVQPVAVATWGTVAGNAVDQLQLGIKDSVIRQGGTAPPRTALSLQGLTFWHQAEVKRKVEKSFAKRL
jgi:hypothetical protein